MTRSSSSVLARRYRSQRRLVLAGKAAIALALVFLLGLIGSVALTSWRALLSAELALTVDFDPAVIGADGQNDVLAYERLVKQALRDTFAAETGKRRARREVYALASFGAAQQLHALVQEQPGLVGTRQQLWVPGSALTEGYLTGAFDLDREPGARALSDAQVAVLDRLDGEGLLRLGFNSRFFVAGDSRDPELAGIGGALMGSLLTLLVTFITCFPLGVGAAIYLELLAPRNRLFDLIEININNLAAVPSIIMGLLGLAVFISLFGLPRSSALVGGLVLSLMTLPTIIVASRAALKAVPPSLLAGALSLGATRMQGIFHMVLPQALPGIMTGSIIGMAQALGETAPLLMIGMVAFVVAVPTGFTDVATSLPVQIFLWSDSPERGFVERTALAIVCLLLFLALMNAAAIYLRQRFARR